MHLPSFKYINISISNIVLRLSRPVSVIFEVSTGMFGLGPRFTTVSYTHLDVYKRQVYRDLQVIAPL